MPHIETSIGKNENDTVHLGKPATFNVRGIGTCDANMVPPMARGPAMRTMLGFGESIVVSNVGEDKR